MTFDQPAVPAQPHVPVFGSLVWSLVRVAAGGPARRFRQARSIELSAAAAPAPVVDIARFRATDEAFNAPVGDAVSGQPVERLGPCGRVGDGAGRLAADALLPPSPQGQGADAVAAFSARLGPALDTPLPVGAEIACRIGVGAIAAGEREAEPCPRLARLVVIGRAATGERGGVA